MGRPRTQAERDSKIVICAALGHRVCDISSHFRMSARAVSNALSSAAKRAGLARGPRGPRPGYGQIRTRLGGRDYLIMVCALLGWRTRDIAAHFGLKYITAYIVIRRSARRAQQASRV